MECRRVLVRSGAKCRAADDAAEPGAARYGGPVGEDAAHLEASVRVADGTTHLVLAGDLDIASAPDVEACLDAIRPLRAPLVVDVSRLLFVDSSGLRAL